VALRAPCPKCGTTCQVEDQFQGKPVKCGKCGHTFVVPAQAAPGAAFRLDIGSATSVGRVRQRNEDSFLVHHQTWFDLDRPWESALVIVADGMGGYAAGDEAARLIVRSVGSYLGALLVSALSGQARDMSPTRLAGSIDDAIKAASRQVNEQARTNPAWKGMGATVAVVLIWEGLALIGHVGDCRVYHHRAGTLTQVTKDQTVVARMVELGTLTPEEAVNHPARNEVLQAVGKTANVTPAAYQVPLLVGDSLIVACDGLHAHVDERVLAGAIRRTGYSGDILANELVELANQGGGSDNCTVVAINCY
jgi:serine/threonine protein phosphatase PrpC